MRKILIIEQHEAGQPRAYADSFYSAWISEKNEGMLMHGIVFYYTLSEDFVKQVAKLCVHDFKEKNEANWYEPKLIECKPVGPSPEMLAEANHPNWIPGFNSRWYVRIQLEYTD